MNKKNLVSFVILFLGNIGSKLIGVLREVLIAYFFGTSAVADAIRLSQTIFLVPLTLLSSEASSSSFIPKFRKYVQEKEYSNANKLFYLLFMMTIAFSIIFMAVALSFLNGTIHLFVSHINSDVLSDTRKMLIPMLIGTVFYTSTILFMWRLQAEGNFIVLSSRAIFQNTFFILFLILAYYMRSNWLIGVGFAASYLILFLTSLRYYFKSPTTRSSSPVVDSYKHLMKSFFQEYRYLIILVVIYQLVVIIERYFASSIGEGGLSAIDYAKFIVDTPVFLLGVPIATIALNNYSGKELEYENKFLLLMAKIIIIFLLPLSMFLIPYSRLIIKILYFRGEFNMRSLALTQSAFIGYTVGLWAMVGSTIFQKIFNASFNGKKVIKLLGIGFLCGLISYFTLGRRFGLLGVTASTSIFYICFFILMINHLKLIRRNIISILISLISSGLVLCLYFAKMNIWWITLIILLYFIIVSYFNKDLLKMIVNMRKKERG